MFTSTPIRAVKVGAVRATWRPWPLVLALGLLVVASPAQGAIAGATYAGVHAGGGTVRFTVGADGTGLVSYRVDDVPGSTCVFVAEGDAGVWEGAPIVGDAFSYTLDTALSVAGAFTGADSASGTIRLFNAAVPGVRPACDSGVLAWTAATTSAPALTVPPAVAAAAPGTTAAPPGSKPAAPRVRSYRTWLRLRRAAHGTLSGRLTSLGSGCARGRKLTLRKGGRIVRTTFTNGKGAFTFKHLKARPGSRLRVTVGARRGPASVCAAGTSKTIRLSPRSPST